MAAEEMQRDGMSPEARACDDARKRAVELAMQCASRGLETNEIVDVLAREITTINRVELRVYAAMGSNQAREAHAPASDSAGCNAGSTPEPVGPITGPADPRLKVQRFEHALLPDDQLGRTALVPVDFARVIFAFSPTRRDVHCVQLDKLGYTIAVGDETHPCLTTQHASLLAAIYTEAQACGMEYVVHNGRPYLMVRTSFLWLHRLLHGDACYGGSEQRRTTQYLNEMRDTPFVFEQTDGKGAFDRRILADWSYEPGSRGRNVFIYLSPWWSQGFVQTDKRNLKPLCIDALRRVRGNSNKLLYVHGDYALSCVEKTEMRFSTILERLGVTPQLDNGRPPEDPMTPSRQRERLRDLWQLDGCILSANRALRVSIAEARRPDDRSCIEGKLVLEVVPVGTSPSVATPNVASGKSVPVLDLPFFQRRKERCSKPRRRVELPQAA